MVPVSGAAVLVARRGYHGHPEAVPALSERGSEAVPRAGGPRILPCS